MARGRKVGWGGGDAEDWTRGRCGAGPFPGPRPSPAALLAAGSRGARGQVSPHTGVVVSWERPGLCRQHVSSLSPNSQKPITLLGTSHKCHCVPGGGESRRLSSCTRICFSALVHLPAGSLSSWAGQGPRGAFQPHPQTSQDPNSG